eukprot:132643-Pelagomonas_calceolata.AAC.1
MQLQASKCSPRQINLHTALQQPRKWHRVRSTSCSTSGTSSVAPAAGGSRPSVVLTREHGKNDKMLQELSKRDIPCIELPLIEHANGVAASLGVGLTSGNFNTCKLCQSSNLVTNTSSGQVLLVCMQQQKKGRMQATTMLALSAQLHMELQSPLHSSSCRPQLPEAVAKGDFDWITITSPEAACVLIEAWSQAGKPQVWNSGFVALKEEEPRCPG